MESLSPTQYFKNEGIQAKFLSQDDIEKAWFLYKKFNAIKKINPIYFLVYFLSISLIILLKGNAETQTLHQAIPYLLTSLAISALATKIYVDKNNLILNSQRDYELWIEKLIQEGEKYPKEF